MIQIGDRFANPISDIIFLSPSNSTSAGHYSSQYLSSEDYWVLISTKSESIAIVLQLLFLVQHLLHPPARPRQNLYLEILSDVHDHLPTMVCLHICPTLPLHPVSRSYLCVLSYLWLVSSCRASSGHADQDKEHDSLKNEDIPTASSTKAFLQKTIFSIQRCSHRPLNILVIYLAASACIFVATTSWGVRNHQVRLPILQEN